MSSRPTACPVCYFPAWDFKTRSSYDVPLNGRESPISQPVSPSSGPRPRYQSLVDSSIARNCEGCKLLKAACDHVARDFSSGKFPSDVRLTLGQNLEGNLSFHYTEVAQSSLLERNIEIFTLPTDPKFLTLAIANLPNPDTGSDDSWQQAQRWIERCEKQHRICAKTAYSGFVPHRLLDVEHGADTVQVAEMREQTSPTQTGDTPIISSILGARRLWSGALGKLRASKNRSRSEPSVDIRYVTLSHCWGPTPDKSKLLTRQSFPSHTGPQGIPVKALPKTFRDAIFMTKRLGIRYVWIDSMCIIQDDEADWHVESGEMASIYSNSWLTMAATASPSDDVGFFPRDTESVGGGVSHLWEDDQVSVVSHQSLKAQRFVVRLDAQDFTVYVRRQAVHPDAGATLFSISELPLLSRAWVFQERLLSRRVLYFGRKELLWECMEGVDCECMHHGASKSPRFGSNEQLLSSFVGATYQAQTKSLLSYLRGHYRHGSTVQYDWRKVVHIYSKLRLTIGDDKLPAISGIAKEFKAALKDDYLAGCWRRTLQEDIGWAMSDFPSTGRCSPSAPSWSWPAAAAGEIAWTYPEKTYFKILDARTSFENGDIGRVQGGELKINGLLWDRATFSSCGLSSTSTDAKLASFNSLRMHDRQTGERIGSLVFFYPDFQFWTTIDNLANMLAKDVTLFIYGSMHELPNVQAILLRPSTRKTDTLTYERIAMIWIKLDTGLGEFAALKLPWQRFALV